MGLTPHEFSSRFWALIGATFLGFLGIGAVLPALAPHIRRDLGGSDQTVGFVIGIFSFIALVSRFISGPLADRRGRKIAFITGLASCALAGGAYLLPFGLTAAYLGRILQGFGEACLYTGAAAWAIELAGVHRSGQALGYLSSGIWGGISAGPVIGAWLGTFPRAAVLQAVAALAAIVMLWFIPEEYTPHPNPPKRRWLPEGIIMPGLAIGFVNVHYPVLTGFLVLHLAQFNAAGPAAFTAYAVIILFSRFFLGGLPDRIAPGITFYFGLVAMTIGLAGIAMASSAFSAIGATALLGLGFSFPWAAIASSVLRRTPDHERGSVMGVLSAFYDLFVGVSSFVAGFVAKRYGYPAAFLMAAASIGLAAFCGRFVFSAAASSTADEREPAYSEVS